MSTGALKFESRQGKSGNGSRSVVKSLLLKSPSMTALSEDDRELIKVTLEARDEWIETNVNFDYVHEEMLVDYYTYKIKACEARYTYFLKLVKEKDLARFL